MSAWQVLIIEDDEKVASIHRRIVAAHPGFEMVAVAASAEEGAVLVDRGSRIDLVLLDVARLGEDGIALLRALRSQSGPEVIAMTAACDPATVESLLHLGVVDHLVKPFAIERLQEGLVRFRERKRILAKTGTNLVQQDIDNLYSRPERSLLPKGLQFETLALIRSALSEASGAFSSADDIARRAFVARVTARRYLEYLVSAHQVEMLASPDGPGRPRKLYRQAQFGK